MFSGFIAWGSAEGLAAACTRSSSDTAQDPTLGPAMTTQPRSHTKSYAGHATAETQESGRTCCVNSIAREPCPAVAARELGDCSWPSSSISTFQVSALGLDVVQPRENMGLILGLQWLLYNQRFHPGSTGSCQKA